MVVCEHLIAGVKKIDLVCDRGTVTFEYCGICGHLVNIFRTKELYIANYWVEISDEGFCQHDAHPEYMKKEPLVCERGNLEIVYCGVCGQYEQSHIFKELYIANYQVYDEIKELQRLREEHAKTTGTTY